MDNIEELKLQNQQDSWTLLYDCLCSEAIRAFGWRGERCIRHSLKAMGEWQGNRARQAHAKVGIPTDLYSLFHYGPLAAKDPRVVSMVRTDTAQERIWDVFTSPVARLLGVRGHDAFGVWYFEEYARAVVLAYTENRGQYCISKNLNCPRDIICQASAYLRPANQTAEQRHRSFGVPRPENVLAPSLHESIAQKTILLCVISHDLLTEMFGADGERAFSNALRAYADEIVSVMQQWANETGMRFDKEFAMLNFSLSLDASEPLWSEASETGNNVAGRVRVLVLDRIKAAFVVH